VSDFVNDYFYYLLLIPCFLGLVGVYYIPLFRVVQLSFMERSLLNPTPKFVGLENYFRVFEHDLFGQSLKNTIIWTVGGVALQFGLGLGAALIASRNFRGRRWFRGAMLVPFITPTVVTAIVWRWMYNPQFGVINEILTDVGLPAQQWLASEQLALLSVILVNTWKGFPFFFVTLLAGLQAIPNNLYEAASVDGAGRIQQFWHVTVPQLKPMINISVILGTVWTFNYLGLVWALTKGGPAHATEILPVLVYRQAFQEYAFGYASAIALVIFAFNLVFVLSYFRVVVGEDDDL
jgi:multiple sugar transport system permease protein